MLLWQQLFYTYTHVSFTQWLGIIALHLYRYYHALFFSGAVILLPLAWYVPGLAPALLVYYMRPSIIKKDTAYLWTWFMPERLVAWLFIALVYTACAALLPHQVTGILGIFVLITYGFLYDTQGSIPETVGLALVRTGYFVLYQLPVVTFLCICATVTVYVCGGVIGSVIQLLVFYPLYASLITVMYGTAIHENYELYYAQ